MQCKHKPTFTSLMPRFGRSYKCRLCDSETNPFVLPTWINVILWFVGPPVVAFFTQNASRDEPIYVRLILNVLPVVILYLIVEFFFSNEKPDEDKLEEVDAGKEW
ncbi:MAG: hypothetical protein FWD25_04220 [Clostridia bacterium]|nr:hypothetical protein [Clostridia bacterium]